MSHHLHPFSSCSPSNIVTNDLIISVFLCTATSVLLNLAASSFSSTTTLARCGLTFKSVSVVPSCYTLEKNDSDALRRLMRTRRTNVFAVVIRADEEAGWPSCVLCDLLPEDSKGFWYHLCPPGTANPIAATLSGNWYLSL